MSAKASATAIVACLALIVYSLDEALGLFRR